MGYDYVRSCGGRPFPKCSITDVQKSLCISVNFMYIWLKIWATNIYGVAGHIMKIWNNI